MNKINTSIEIEYFCVCFSILKSEGSAPDQTDQCMNKLFKQKVLLIFKYFIKKIYKSRQLNKRNESICQKNGSVELANFR